jgi:hypothetical protein
VCHYLDIEFGATWRAGSEEEAETAFSGAREVIGFQDGCAKLFKEGHEIVHAHKTAWEAEGRKSGRVRLRVHDLYHEVKDKQILSEREWRVLCAVFSAIGNKEMVALGWKGIQSRAAGRLPPPPDAKPWGPKYSRGQIERSADELIARGFVFAATYNRGERYWTHRNNHADLWKEIAALKLRRASAQADRVRIDRTASDEIRAQLKLATVVAPPAVNGCSPVSTDALSAKVAGRGEDGVVSGNGRPSSIDEVRAYGRTLELPESDAEAFYDHYEANGWLQGGRTPIRSWPAALRGWKRKASDFGKDSVAGAAAPFNPKAPNAHTGGIPFVDFSADEQTPDEKALLNGLL